MRHPLTRPSGQIEQVSVKRNTVVVELPHCVCDGAPGSQFPPCLTLHPQVKLISCSMQLPPLLIASPATGFDE